MPTPSTRIFDRLNDMSDEELRQILRRDASKPEGEDTDMELIFHVMEVLATRRNDCSQGISPAQALDSFHQNYCTEAEHHLILDPDAAFPKPCKCFIFKRFAAVAAVLVLVFALSTVSAQAWDFAFWDTIIEWTQETFHFGHLGQASTPAQPTHQDTSAYAGLQDVLDSFEMQAALVPTWIPEGFVELEVDIVENPRQRIIFAAYQKEENTIAIQIIDHLGTDPNEVEQSGHLLDVYLSGGIQYYIFENRSHLQAVWLNHQYEGMITGNLTLDELKCMIDSIMGGT